MQDELKQRVLEVYASVDAAVAAAGPRCDSSGRCCRFKEYGHTLFISRFEAEILLETAPLFEQPVGPDGCPFQIDNLCTARAERPLGCRIYFCDPSYQETGNALTESALAKLKSLADEFEVGWEYAPLHVFLNRFERTDSMTAPPQSPRISLPLAKPETP